MSFQRWAMPPQKQLSREEVSDIVLQNPQISVDTTFQLMKKLSAIAVSTIMYLRGVFPEDAFYVKMMEGQKVFVLKQNENPDSSETLRRWLKSALMLVDSQNLKKMYLVIKQGEVTLEMYTLSFTYNKDAISCNLFGEDVVLTQSVPEEISKSVRNMIRAIIMSTTSCMKPLPNDFELCVKLQLDESTPQDVVPSVFQPSLPEDILDFPVEVETMKLGKIKTKFGTFAVATKSVLNCEYDSGNGENQDTGYQVEDLEDEVPGSQENEMTSVLNTPQIQRKSPENEEPGHYAYTSDMTPVMSKAAGNDSELAESLSIVSLKEKIINCICECGSVFDNTIQCVSCSTFQHKACYKLRDYHNIRGHICVSCHDPDLGKICSVPELLNDDNRKASALFRQALMFCCTNAQVSCKRIMSHLNVPRRVAEKIFQQLDNSGCFQPATNKGYIRSVKLDLNESIGQYFIASSSSDCTVMDTQTSAIPSTSSAPTQIRNYNHSKRPLEEEKENISPESSFYSIPKRSKVIKTPPMLTSPSY